MNTNHTIEIMLKSDGIHTDYVFPIKSNQIDWRSVFPLSDLKDSMIKKEYISIGWGDQGFFLHTPQWSDLTFQTAFNAMFYRGKSAIHINYLNKNEITVKKINLQITPKQYKMLIYFIKSTLVQKNHKFLCIKNKGYWNTDAFYQAKPNYGLFHTCNGWINTGLKKSNIKSCLWTPFNFGIFSKYL